MREFGHNARRFSTDSPSLRMSSSRKIDMAPLSRRSWNAIDDGLSLSLIQSDLTSRRALQSSEISSSFPILCMGSRHSEDDLPAALAIPRTPPLIFPLEWLR